MLETKNLAFAYPGRTALLFPDLTCSQGEHWLLLGESGTGKTTWLHLLGGLRRPTGGSIVLDGRDLSQLPTAEMDTFRGQHIGIIFQQSHFVDSITVEENLKLAQQLAGKPMDKKRIQYLLENLKISHKSKALPRNLSVGEQQRAAIARALINQPRLILADEPTSALDDSNTVSVIELLKNQAREANAILLIVTHDNRLKTEFKYQMVLQDKAFLV